METKIIVKKNNRKKTINKIIAASATAAVVVSAAVPVSKGFENLIDKDQKLLDQKIALKTTGQAELNHELEKDARKIDEILSQKLFNRINTNYIKIVAYNKFVNTNSYSKKPTDANKIKNGHGELYKARLFINNKFAKTPNTVKIVYKVIRSYKVGDSFANVQQTDEPPQMLANGDRVKVFLQPTSSLKDLTNEQAIIFNIQGLLSEGPKNLKYIFKYDDQTQGIISGEGSGRIITDNNNEMDNYKWVYAVVYGYLGVKDRDSTPKNEDYSIKIPHDLKNGAAVFYKLITKDGQKIYNDKYQGVTIIENLRKTINVDQNILKNIDVTFYKKDNYYKILELKQHDSKLNLIDKGFPKGVEIEYFKNNKKIQLSLLTVFDYKDTFGIRVKPQKNVVFQKDIKNQELFIKHVVKVKSKNFLNQNIFKKVINYLTFKK